LPRRLRLLDVLPGGLSLFRSSHIASLLCLFSLERKQGATVGLRIADCGLRIYELVRRGCEMEIENCINPQSAIRNPQSAIPLSLAL
jgi:hypothetical protein